MPTLAEIYNQISNTIGDVKRKGSDFARNPGASLQQMLIDANDRAGRFNQATADAANATLQTRKLGNPQAMALAEQIGEGYNPAGMTVFHGSPHIFERFDMSKLGTGEGAQAYGSGLYMAQNPKIAKNYQDTLAYKAWDLSPEAEKLGLNLPAGTRGEFMRQVRADKPPEVLARQLQNANIAARELPHEKLTALFEAYKKNGGGQMYKVDLPDTHIRRMLDWDAPLKNQPSQVRNLAKSLGMDLNDLGGDLLVKVGKDEIGRKTLQDAGIPGVKYLDQTSRNAAGWHITPPSNTVSGKWMVKGSDYNSKGVHFENEKEAQNFLKQKLGEETRNFVVFDQNHLKILERNNEALK